MFEVYNVTKLSQAFEIFPNLYILLCGISNFRGALKKLGETELLLDPESVERLGRLPRKKAENVGTNRGEAGLATHLNRAVR